MNPSGQEPIWLQILLALLPASVGAASALIAVYLTQRHSHQEQQLKMFERLFEPHYHAHQEIFIRLSDLQDEIKRHNYQPHSDLQSKLDKFTASTKQNLIWLDESIANEVIDIIEKVSRGLSNKEIDTDIQKDIIETQRSIRYILGVSDFSKLVERLRKK